MASLFNFRCTTQTARFGAVVININSESRPSQLQVVCVSGTIDIEGESGSILGIPVSAITLLAGQSMNFNEDSYARVTITIAAGSVYQLISNQ